MRAYFTARCALPVGLLLTACDAMAVQATDTHAIGPNGGTVSAATGPAAGASVSVPAGALTTYTTLTISSGDPATMLPAGVRAVGPVIVFGPEGQMFANPVTVTLPTTAPATTIFTRPIGGTAWAPIPTDLAAADGRSITGHVTHFSAFVATASDTDANATSDVATDATATSDVATDAITASDSGSNPNDDATSIDADLVCDGQVDDYPTFVSDSAGGCESHYQYQLADLNMVAAAASNVRCAANPSGEVFPTSDNQLENLFLGVWLKCSSSSIVTDSPDEIGFEAGADCAWYRLFRDPSTGAVTRSSATGWWFAGYDKLFIDPPDDAGGQVPAHAVFYSTTPAQVFLFDNATCTTAMYVHM